MFDFVETWSWSCDVIRLICPSALFFAQILFYWAPVYVVDNHCFITHNDKQKGCVCKSKPQGYITIKGSRNILSLFLKVCMWLNELAKSIHAFWTFDKAWMHKVQSTHTDRHMDRDIRLSLLGLLSEPKNFLSFFSWFKSFLILSIMIIISSTSKIYKSRWILLDFISTGFHNLKIRWLNCFLKACLWGVGQGHSC